MTMTGATSPQSRNADLQERRMVFRVAREWVILKRQKPYPSINHLHPSTFSTDWSWCLIARSLSDRDTPTKDRLEFEFVGGSFHEDAPSCVAGTRLDSVPYRSRLRFATELVAKMFELRTAIISHGIFVWSNTENIRYRTIIFPFSDNAGALKYAVGAFSHVLTTDGAAAQPGTTGLLAFRSGHWHAIEDIPSSRP